MRLLAIASTVLLLSANLARAQRNPIIDELLDRATASVQDFMSRFTRVVAEEQYVQEYLLSSPEGSRGTFTGAPKVVERRNLKSDFLLVKPSGSAEWYIFRDVFDVDGRAVRDRDARLAKLFLEAPDTATALERARQIAAASAQFNIKAMGTVDHPLLALGFLQPAYRGRFRFTPRGRDASAGDDVRVVEYRETARPTLIRGSGDRDVFARGRYWIDGATGRIVRTEVVFSAIGTESSVTTTFGFDDRLSANMPVEMRFKRSASTNEVRGTATYGRFRQFEVGTEETIQEDRIEK
jgi:hypothetical protein